MIQKIVLGTVQLGIPYGVNNRAGKPDTQTAFDILNEAWAQGIPELDTAADYGDSETVIGSWRRTSNKSFQMMSKASGLTNLTFVDQIKLGCAKLSVDNLDGFYFHRFSEFKEMIHSPLLNKVKQQGLVKKIGVSLYDLEELRIAASHPEVNVIQLPYNLLDHSTEKRELLMQAKDAGKAIYARSVFLQGLFFMPLEKLPTKLVSLKEPLSQLHKIAEQKGITMDQLALNFVLQSSVIDKVLIGVESVDQLKKNLSAILSTDLGTSLLREIDQIKVSDETLLSPVNWGAL